MTNVTRIGGVIINVVLLIFLLVLVCLGLVQRHGLKNCETQQSFFCITTTCPCDDISTSPCKGYALREVSGQYFCSNAPLTAVDSQGNIA